MYDKKNHMKLLWYYVLTFLWSDSCLFSSVILNDAPLPMMLFQLDALPWMPFSVVRQKFQLGILLPWTGKKFNYPLNFYLMTRCLIFCVGFMQFRPSRWFQVGIADTRAWICQGKSQQKWWGWCAWLFDEISLFFYQWGHICIILFLHFQLDAVVLAQQLRKRFLDQVQHYELACYFSHIFIFSRST